MRTRSVRRILIVVALAGVHGASPALAQNTRSRKQPHTAVDRPDFVAASRAGFVSSSDVLIGVATGGAAKAYLAADVGQHGVVHDQMADGPIAVTWCEICNTGLVFRAEAKGQALHFDSALYTHHLGRMEKNGKNSIRTRWC